MPHRRTAVRSTIVVAMMALTVLSSIGQTKGECLTCHAERSLTMEKKGKTISLFVDASAYETSAHAALACVACHEQFKPDRIPHARRLAPAACTACHAKEKFVHYERSVHGMAKGTKPAVACTDCHSKHAIQHIAEKGVEQKKLFAEQICAKCHSAIAATYRASDHGLALHAGVRGAPTCIDCHGEHNVVSPTTEGAQTSRKNEASMCLHCHLDDPEVRTRVGPSAGFISSYEKSVHARAVQQGNEAAATCTDCHGSHEMKKGAHPDSKVSQHHIAATCGQCHGDIREQYERSIHGKALERGVIASATCTDCHGEHNILSPHDPRSPVAPKNVSAQVCSPCHASVKLTEKYGLASDRFKSFADSYHGLASRAGAVEVANCASCHGVHDIQPSSDPTSRIHPANLAATCGLCHPGANENFTKGKVHVIATASDDTILYYIAMAYIALIVVTIGGMVIHNVLDFIKKAKRELMYRRGVLPRPHHELRLYMRMTLDERIQHGILAFSFMLLVVTGFALRFSDAWWVTPIRNLSPIMFDLTSLFHRIGGVVLIGVSLYHVYYIIAVPRGKQLFRDMIPVRKDLRDFVGAFRYYLGFSNEKPKFGRFSYIEKAEYWALIWGTVVMGATGIILWFDNTFMALLTKLGWDIARTIHYYEAWLTTLAILVWHFYFVIFNPNCYPLNLAFWKGTVTEEEMAEEHPLELEEIKRREMMQRVTKERTIEEEPVQSSSGAQQ